MSFVESDCTITGEHFHNYIGSHKVCCAVPVALKTNERAYDYIPCSNCGHGKLAHRDVGATYRCLHRNDGNEPRLVWVAANTDPNDMERFKNGGYHFDCDCTAYSPSRQPTESEIIWGEIV